MATYRFDKDAGKVVKKEDEHPSYVSFLTPHIRSHTHGQHRRTSPKTHRNPSDGASTGAGGTFTRVALPSAAWRALNTPAFPLSKQVPSTIAYGGGGKGVTLVDYAKALGYHHLFDTPPDPSPPTLPYAGIRTGEIIGHRLWWVLPDGLCSLTHRFRWEPGATVEGDLEKVVWSRAFQPPIYGGVYAYANHSVELIIESEELYHALTRRVVFTEKSPGVSAIGLVRGTVKLWGEVVEHETGWRAQFAKLASIREWWGDPARVPKVLEPYYAAHSL